MVLLALLFLGPELHDGEWSSFYKLVEKIMDLQAEESRNRASTIPVRLEPCPKMPQLFSSQTGSIGENRPTSRLTSYTPAMPLVTTLALASALVSTASTQSACPEFPADPALLIPDTATAALGVDVDAFAKTSTGRALLPALRADLQLAEALEIIEDCGLELDRTYAVSLARDDADGRLLTIQARGIGAETTLTCLAAELRARNDGTDPWTRAAGTCAPTLELGDRSRAWVVNAYTLVWAKAGFVDAVGARLEGREPMALPANLSAEFARLDRSGHLWLAARLDDDDRGALPGAWAAQTQSLTAAVSFDDGLFGVFSLSAADVAATANLRDLALASFADLAARLDEFGVEHGLRERARVGIVNGVVAAQVEFDERELVDLRDHVGARIVGRGPL